MKVNILEYRIKDLLFSFEKGVFLMIDIHSHIIFDVDDGPKSIEESIKMLYSAVDEGITEIVFTSHAFHPQYHAQTGIVKERFDVLREGIKIHDIPLNIHIGHEVRLNDQICPQLDKGKVLTLANSRYLLLELPSQGVPKYTFEIINQLVTRGIVPVIAHPERNYGIMEKPELLERLVFHGAISQINAGSIVGHFGKRIQQNALKLIKANIIHAYGSDVHNLSKRPFLYAKGLSYLEKHKCSDFVDIFLENNARILANSDVIILEPEKILKRKWLGLFSQ